MRVDEFINSALQPVHDPATQLRNRAIATLCIVLGFICSLPYPAINFGNTSALQLGNVLTVMMCVPLIFISWKNRPFGIYSLLLAPLFISATVIALRGTAEASLSFKFNIAWGISFLSLVTSQLYAPRYSLEMLTGIAVAAVLHVAVGFYQYYCFMRLGVFPFVELYVNQSFLSVQNNADMYARWMQRPFGIFPEPSAMACSLAPWLLFWFAEIAGVLRLRRPPAVWQRALFGVAAAGSLALIILSRSGHAGVTLFGVMVIAALWVKNCKATLRTYLIVVAVFAVVIPVVLWFGAQSLGDRMKGGGVGNSSWEDRSNSMIVGFKLWTDGDVGSLIFGLGAGQTGPLLWHKAGLEAVWSVSLTYVYETGLVGLFVCILIGHYLVKTWRHVGYDLTLGVVMLAWVVGVTLTTSYVQLLSPWLVLGWMTVWPAICEPTRQSFFLKRHARADLRGPAVPRRFSWNGPQTVPATAFSTGGGGELKDRP